MIEKLRQIIVNKVPHFLFSLVQQTFALKRTYYVPTIVLTILHTIRALIVLWKGRQVENSKTKTFAISDLKVITASHNGKGKKQIRFLCAVPVKAPL